MSESPAPRRNPAALILLFIGAALFGVGAAALILSYTKQDTTLASVPINMSMSSLLREGKPAPTFTLKTLDGKNNVALADLRGKTLLINFWASWCPPCIEETPDLAAAYKEIADPNVVFIGIGLQDENANLRKFADDNKIPYLVVEDPDGKVGDAYGVRGMPTTIYVDRDGIVRTIVNGAVKREAVVAQIAAMSKE
ncbi:MAG: TlpA disulfide reductase family protein [Chloroflexi bacterium]|nr:TlpA disulfide reductase family protein [Chloroflexota bacterium]